MMIIIIIIYYYYYYFYWKLQMSSLTALNSVVDRLGHAP